MLQLESAGIECFDVRTQRGAYAGLIARNQTHGFWRVYFDSNATKGSARKFATAETAIEYIVARRIKKGWRI